MSSNDAGDGSPSPDPESDQDESSIMAEDKKIRASSEDKSPGNSSNGTKPAKSNNKDPSRPRRKKARRACHACQRAHLTCGDERPCLRCVKRGIEGNCHDGVRKKAKYLHDAPAEALLPGYQGGYNSNGLPSISSASGAPMTSGGIPITQPSNYYPTSTSQYPQYNAVGTQVIDNVNMVGNITQRPSVGSPTQYQQPQPAQQVTPVQDITNAMNQPATLGSMGNPSFEASLFDPNDLTAFNFNLSDLNFGNHYGALELSMLGHMTSGAVNTPEMEMMDSMSHSNAGSMSYDGTSGLQSFPYTQNFQTWNNRQGSTTNLWALQHNGQDAFAVADTGGSLTGASPLSQNQDWSSNYMSGVSPETRFVQPDHAHHHESSTYARPGRRSAPFPTDFGPMNPRKRRRDTKQIYNSVTKPYPYTERFHTFFAFLQRRYPTEKRVRIAKALSNIRPSFIALTKDLSEDDLIFMEQGFQRQLVDYDDTWQQIGTPSIICRRTGEIVSCNKEFSLVTGWGRDVLLGRAANLNVNFGIAASSGTHTGANTRGTATPRIPGQPDTEAALEATQQPTVPQPVFLAELMDQDSMVDFWEDFSERAFAGSTAAVTGACCTLIKYKTKNDEGWGANDTFEGGVKNEGPGGGVFVKGEAGMKALGEQDGKIEVSMTWLVRRDMFDIPMMIVMNFLPVI